MQPHYQYFVLVLTMNLQKFSDLLENSLERGPTKNYFSKFQLCPGGKFNWWRKLEYQEKTTDLPQVTDKLYHMMLY